MKKHYGYFVYNGKSYVIRFKVEGIEWDSKHHCFMDSDWYTRSAEDMICLAALDSNPSNCRGFESAYLLTHKGFKIYRAQGIPRWTPSRSEIHW